MADDTRDIKPEAVDTALGEMKLEEGGSHSDADDTVSLNGTYERPPKPDDMKRSSSTSPGPIKSALQSPAKKHSGSQTPKSEYNEEHIGGEITVTVEPGEAPKLSRKSSQKVVSRPATLFDHVLDSTDEATSGFQVIKDCIYGSKYMGYSEHDALDCDCSEEWSKSF